MKADEREGADEIEQHAETDGISSKQLTIAEMSQHLPARGKQSVRAYKSALIRQQECHCDGAGEGYGGERGKTGAPTDIIGQQTGHQPPAEAAETRARRINASGGGCFLGAPLIADIRDRDREN